MSHHHSSFMFVDNKDVRYPQHVFIDDPPIGNKIHLLTERGLFVLERGACVWLGLSCTHAGSGGIVVYDGVPDENGFFPDPPEAPRIFNDKGLLVTSFNRDIADRCFDDQGRKWTANDVEELLIDHARAMANRNGRRVSYAHPAAMGMWMYSAGLQYGLTVETLGEMASAASIMTFTWMKPKQRA